MSPSLKKGICIGYIESRYYQKKGEVYINIRGKKKKGCIVDSPFYKNGSLLNQETINFIFGIISFQSITLFFIIDIFSVYLVVMIPKFKSGKYGF